MIANYRNSAAAATELHPTKTTMQLPAKLDMLILQVPTLGTSNKTVYIDSFLPLHKNPRTLSPNHPGRVWDGTCVFSGRKGANLN